jgi:hypothetical protein
MNPLTIRFALLCAAISLLLIACGNADTTNGNTTDTTGTTDTTANLNQAATPTASNIVTTPENIVVARYKVSDYAKWRTQYDTRDSMRTANGLHNYVLGRGAEDSNTVMVAVKADDMAKARAFAQSAALQSALQKGYVKGKPTYTFCTVVYQDMSPNMSDLRSMSFFTVKDWDAWKKAFESGRGLREENGLTDRAYGYEADDNHKVVVVAAINDSAKAAAYWRSDTLKQRRAAAGVTGEVERFVYRVVQKY